MRIARRVLLSTEWYIICYYTARSAELASVRGQEFPTNACIKSLI